MLSEIKKKEKENSYKIIKKKRSGMESYALVVMNRQNGEIFADT